MIKITSNSYSLESVSADHLGRWALTALLHTPFPPSALRRLWDVAEPEPYLHALLTRHLVMGHRQPLPSGDEAKRYRLHDLMRILAQELLAQQCSEVTENASRRLMAHFLGVTKELDRLTERPNRLDLRDHHFLFSQAIADIRAGIAFAKNDAAWESAEALVGFGLSDALSRRLPASDRLELVDAALATVGRWVNERPEEAKSHRRSLLLERASALRALSRPAEAEACLRERVSAAEAAGVKPDLAAFWSQLGALLLTQPQRTEDALLAFRSGLKNLDKDSAPRERSALLNNCGNALMRLGDLKAAKDAYWVSQSIDEEIGDDIGVATSLGNLANIAIFEGDYSEARKLAKDAADQEAAHGLDQAQAQSLQILGKTCFLDGDFPAAREAFAAAAPLHEAQGEVISVVKARVNIAAVDYQTGDLPRAYGSARMAIKSAHQSGCIGEAAGAMRTLAMIFLDMNRRRSAFRIIRCALAYHTASHSRAEMIEDVFALVRVFTIDGQPKVALRYLDRVDAWIEDHGQSHHRVQSERMRRELEKMSAQP